MMMIDLCNRLVDNDLTREELLPNIEITKMSYADAPIIVGTLSKSFGIHSEEGALRQLIYSNAQMDESVKVIDKRTGEIYGFLIFSKYPLHVGSPIMHINARLGGFLAQFRQINGHSFMLDERLRGLGIDKKMLKYNEEYIKQYEMIWLGVEESLRSGPYWKRLGFKEVMSIPEATFYVMFTKVCPRKPTCFSSGMNWAWLSDC